MSRTLLLALTFIAGIGAGIMDRRWGKAQAENARLLSDRDVIETNIGRITSTLDDVPHRVLAIQQSTTRLLNQLGLPRYYIPVRAHPARIARDKARAKALAIGGRYQP